MAKQKPVVSIAPIAVAPVGGKPQYNAQAHYQVGKVPALRSSTQQGNAQTWALLTAALAKGPLTGAALMAVAQQRNHATFMGYAIGNGWLVAVPAPKAAPRKAKVARKAKAKVAKPAQPATPPATPPVQS